MKTDTCVKKFNRLVPIITARIRMMREGKSFSLFTLAERGIPRPRPGWGLGGGYPIPGLGGEVPHPRSGWGYPILLMGGTPSQVHMGYTPSQVWMGYPIQGLDREVPHPRSGGGTLGHPPPSVKDWMGYPHARLDGVPPNPRVDGVPPLLPPPTHISKAGTCYAAGDVPLAFTLEDFLVTCHMPL